MRTSIFSVVLASLAMGGCSVRVPVEQASAQELSKSEVSALNQAGHQTSVPGKWLRLNVAISRASARKIARWELYTHVPVEECSTDRLVSILDNVHVQGSENFDDLRKLLETDGRAEFFLSGPIFVPEGKTTDNLCVRLEGGGYTLQRISSDQVPLVVGRKASQT